MAKSRYRDRLDIIADVLSVTGESARKTRIMFGANLSFELVNRYLTDVMEAELVSVGEDGRSYSLTERGKEFLKRYDEYSKMRKRAEEQSNSIEYARYDLESLCTGGVRKESLRRVG